MLAEHGATPTCHRRVVGVDLRDDWVSALQASPDAAAEYVRELRPLASGTRMISEPLTAVRR